MKKFIALLFLNTLPVIILLSSIETFTNSNHVSAKPVLIDGSSSTSFFTKKDEKYKEQDGDEVKKEYQNIKFAFKAALLFNSNLAPGIGVQYLKNSEKKETPGWI